MNEIPENKERRNKGPDKKSAYYRKTDKWTDRKSKPDVPYDRKQNKQQLKRIIQNFEVEDDEFEDWEDDPDF